MTVAWSPTPQHRGDVVYRPAAPVRRPVDAPGHVLVDSDWTFADLAPTKDF